jgi:hypothetical protein
MILFTSQLFEIVIVFLQNRLLRHKTFLQSSKQISFFLIWHINISFELFFIFCFIFFFKSRRVFSSGVRGVSLKICCHFFFSFSKPFLSDKLPFLVSAAACQCLLIHTFFNLFSFLNDLACCCCRFIVLHRILIDLFLDSTKFFFILK